MAAAPLFRRFGGEEGGNVAMLFAAFMVLATALGAFAVDEGAVYLEDRTAQSATDLAALAAATDPGAAYAVAKATLADAGVLPAGIDDETLASPDSQIRLSVETGRYSADPTLAVAQRFVAGGTPPNAVHVAVTRPAQLYFAAPWARTPVIGVEAVASATPEVSFSVGSTLLSMNEGLPNALLNALLGANVSLSAASYNGLVGSEVSLFGFLDALAQELSISAGTYNDVLAASSGRGSIARAIAAASDGAEAAAATTVADALDDNATIPLAKLLDLGPFGGLAIGTGKSSGYDAHLSALQLLAATAGLSDGVHQATLNLGAAIPGLASLTMTVAVGEPAQFASWFALGPSGSVARTAQIRVRFVVTLAGGTGLSNGVIRLPLFIDSAYAEAGVTAAACPALDAATGSATIGTQPGVVRVTVGDVSDAALDDFSTTPTPGPATLLNLLLLRITASGSAAISATAPIPLDFSAAEITAGTVKRAATTTFTQSLINSLLSSLTLNVSLGPLSLLSVSGVTQSLNALLAPVGPVLDSTLASTFNALGVTLGAADVRVYGVTCKRPVLVR
jgi:uncharacterized membrane protein